MSQDPLEASLSADLTLDADRAVGIDDFATTGAVFDASSPLSRINSGPTNVPRPPSSPQSPQQPGRRAAPPVPLPSPIIDARNGVVAEPPAAGEAGRSAATTVARSSSSASTGGDGGGGGGQPANGSGAQGPLVFRGGSNGSTPNRAGHPASPSPPAVLGGVAAAAAISAGCPTKSSSTGLGPRPPPTPPLGQHRSGSRMRGRTGCGSPISLPPCPLDALGAEVAVAVVDTIGALGVGGVGYGVGRGGGPLDAARPLGSAGSSGSLDGCGLARGGGGSSSGGGNGGGAVSGGSCPSRGLTTPTTVCMSACAGVSGRTTNTNSFLCVGASYQPAKTPHPAGACAGAAAGSRPTVQSKHLANLTDVTSSPGEQTPGGTQQHPGRGFNPCADPRLAALRAACPSLVLGPCPPSGASALAAQCATIVMKACPTASSPALAPAAACSQSKSNAGCAGSPISMPTCTAEEEARWYRNCLPTDLHCLSDAPTSDSDIEACPLNLYRPAIRAAAAAAAAGAAAGGADKKTATSIALAAVEAAAKFHKRQMEGLPPEEMKPGNCPELLTVAWQLHEQLATQVQCPKTAAAAAWTLPPMPKDVLAQMTPEGTEKLSDECKRKISECARKRREQMLKFQVERAEQILKLQANNGRPLPPPAQTCPLATAGGTRPPLAPNQRQHLGTDDDDATGTTLHRPLTAGVSRGGALSSNAKPWVPPESVAVAASGGGASGGLFAVSCGQPQPQPQQCSGGWTVSCGQSATARPSAVTALPSVFPSIRIGGRAATANATNPAVVPGVTAGPPIPTAPSVSVTVQGGPAPTSSGPPPGGAMNVCLPSLESLSALYGPSASMAVKQACLAKAAAMSGLATVPAAGTPEAYFLMGQITAFAAIRQQQQTAAAAMAVAGGSSGSCAVGAPPPPPRYQHACTAVGGLPPPAPGYFMQMGHPPAHYPPQGAHVQCGQPGYAPGYAHIRGGVNAAHAPLMHHQTPPPHGVPAPPYDAAAFSKKSAGVSTAGSPSASVYNGGGEASTTASVGSCTPRISTIRGSTTSSMVGGPTTTARLTPLSAGGSHHVVRASSIGGVSAGSAGAEGVIFAAAACGAGTSISDMSSVTLPVMDGGATEVLTTVVGMAEPTAMDGGTTMDADAAAATATSGTTTGKKRRKRGGGGGGGAAAAATAAAAGVDGSAGVIDGATDAPTGAEAQPEGEAGDRSATKPTPFAVPEGTVFFDAIPVLAYNLTNAPLPEGYALPPDSSGDGRYKQLCHGFTSAEYARYRRLVPRHRRQVGNPSHPLTPRAEFSMTRRAFRDLVFQWRQDLHRWDTITSADEAFAEGLPTMLEAGWEPEEETNEVALRALIRDAHRTLGHSEDEIRQLGLLEDDDNDEDDNDGPTAASAAAAVAPAAPPAPAAG